MHKEQVIGLGIVLVTGLFLASPVLAGDSHHQKLVSTEHREKMMVHDDQRDRDWRWWIRHDDNEDRNLSTELRGDQEVPGPGDPDGHGDARLRVKPGREEVCAELKVHNIDPATAAHIHKGRKGEAGPVVISLPTPNAEGIVNGCVSASKDVLKDIKKHSSDYYVNIHNGTYPDGAIRGQLHN